MINVLKQVSKFSSQTNPIFPIFVTKNAWKKIEDILSSSNFIAMKFSAEGGGCNGFNYRFNPININEYNMLREEKINPTIIKNGDSTVSNLPFACIFIV